VAREIEIPPHRESKNLRPLPTPSKPKKILGRKEVRTLFVNEKWKILWVPSIKIRKGIPWYQQL